MLGVAIIGCGDMGKKHAAAWAARNEVRIIAVCDLDVSRARSLAAQYGAVEFSNWQTALDHTEVNIISICVPTCHHRNIAVTAASSGRHILCEKAMALTLAEADEMIAAAEVNRVKLAVCHQYRALSRFRKMKRLVDDGRLGSPIYIRFTEMREVQPKLEMHSRSKNGGPVHDMTGHLFDLARYLTGSEAETVSAVGTVFGKNKERLRFISDFGIDTAEIQMRFKGGHCLSIGLNWGLPEHTPGHCQELICGPSGMAFSGDPANPDRFLGDISDTVGVVFKNPEGTAWLECDKDHDGPSACIDELIAAIRHDAQSQFDGRQGRAALRLILASLEAMDSGLTIRLD